MSPTKLREPSVRSYVRSKRAYLVLLAGLIAVFLLVAYVGFGTTWETLRQLNPLIFVGVSALSIVGSLIAAARLRILLRIHGHEVAYPDVYHINVVGVLGDELTYVGGEFLRIFLLSKRGVHPTSSVTCALLAKILDVTIVFFLTVFLTFLVVSGLLSTLALLVVATLVFFLCFFIVITLVSRGYIYRGVQRILSRIKIRGGSTKKFYFSKGIGVILVLMSYARWLVFGLLEYLVVRALGIDLDITSVLTIFAVSTIVRVASPLPFGLGVTEAVTAGLYSYFGAASGAAMAAALVTRTYVTLMISILGIYGGLRIGFDALRRAQKNMRLRPRISMHQNRIKRQEAENSLQMVKKSRREI
jgi:uncharacterized protein (TIRG00374 family)